MGGICSEIGFNVVHYSPPRFLALFILSLSKDFLIPSSGVIYGEPVEPEFFILISGVG